jgi:cytochrome c oxidase cbb3-type subunit 3
MMNTRLLASLLLAVTVGCDNGTAPSIGGAPLMQSGTGGAGNSGGTAGTSGNAGTGGTGGNNNTGGVGGTGATGGNSAALARGAVLYEAYCGFCHGAMGQGYASDNANALANPNFLASADDTFLVAAIEQGRPGTPMSAWGRAQGGPLPSADVANLLAFIRQWGTALEVTLGGPNTGSGQAAEQNYATFCASCHGPSGDGETAVSLNNPWFLQTASDGFIRYAINEGRPQTPMGPYKNSFTAQEIEDLVALIRSWATPVDNVMPMEYVPDLTDLVLNPGGNEPSFTLREDKFVAVDDVHAAIQSGLKVIMLDARAHGDYLYGHISGAISLPFYNLADYIDQLPRDVWIINYCGCPHAVSGRAWEALKAAGFEKTAVLDEGYYVWRDRGYPISGADVPMPPTEE